MSGQLAETLRRAALRDPERRFHQLYDKLYRPDILGQAFERACARGGRPSDYHRGRLEGEAKRLRSGTFRPGRAGFGDRVVEEALLLVLEPVLLPGWSFDAWGAVRAVRDLLGCSGGPVAAFTVRPDRDGILDLLELRIADRRLLTLVRAFLASGPSPDVLDFGLLHVPRLGGGLGSLLAEYRLAAWERGLALPDRVVRGGNEVVLVGTPMERVFAEIPVPEARPVDPYAESFVFLGFSWHKRRGTGEAVFQPDRKAVLAVRSRIGEITRGKTHLELGAMVEKVNRPLAGWGAYYRICPNRAAMKKIDGYVRERLAIWSARKHSRSGPGLGRPEVSRTGLREVGLVELGKLPPARWD